MGRVKYEASHGNDKSEKQSHALLTKKWTGRQKVKGLSNRVFQVLEQIRRS
jgi:hypothetical protein